MSKMADLYYRMFGRRKAYRGVFQDGSGNLTPQGRAVLSDLARFCRVSQSSVTVSPISRTIDTHATMVAEGRREVFNRLQYYLNLSDDQLMQIKERSDET